MRIYYLLTLLSLHTAGSHARGNERQVERESLKDGSTEKKTSPSSLSLRELRHTIPSSNRSFVTDKRTIEEELETIPDSTKTIEEEILEQQWDEQSGVTRRSLSIPDTDLETHVTRTLHALENNAVPRPRTADDRNFKKKEARPDDIGISDYPVTLYVMSDLTGRKKSTIPKPINILKANQRIQKEDDEDDEAVDDIESGSGSGSDEFGSGVTSITNSSASADVDLPDVAAAILPNSLPAQVPIGTLMDESKTGSTSRIGQLQFKSLDNTGMLPSEKAADIIADLPKVVEKSSDTMPGRAKMFGEPVFSLKGDSKDEKGSSEDNHLEEHENANGEDRGHEYKRHGHHGLHHLHELHGIVHGDSHPYGKSILEAHHDDERNDEHNLGHIHQKYRVPIYHFDWQKGSRRSPEHSVANLMKRPPHAMRRFHEKHRGGHYMLHHYHRFRSNDHGDFVPYDTPATPLAAVHSDAPEKRHYGDGDEGYDDDNEDDNDNDDNDGDDDGDYHQRPTEEMHELHHMLHGHLNLRPMTMGPHYHKLFGHGRHYAKSMIPLRAHNDNDGDNGGDGDYYNNIPTHEMHDVHHKLHGHLNLHPIHTGLHYNTLFGHERPFGKSKLLLHAEEQVKKTGTKRNDNYHGHNRSEDRRPIYLHLWSRLFRHPNLYRRYTIARHIDNANAPSDETPNVRIVNWIAKGGGYLRQYGKEVAK